MQGEGVHSDPKRRFPGLQTEKNKKKNKEADPQLTRSDRPRQGCFGFGGCRAAVPIRSVEMVFAAPPPTISKAGHCKVVKEEHNDQLRKFRREVKVQENMSGGGFA
mmetsp:Transcript_2534/g.4300  ORF Transcript_2534/g.4300 Transcript_2534/m.4300 type:complete len:106 (-) Transcript_2534:467-784(-)